MRRRHSALVLKCVWVRPRSLLATSSGCEQSLSQLASTCGAEHSTQHLPTQKIDSMKQLPPPDDQCRGQRHAYVMPVTVVQRHAIRPFCLTVAPAAVPNELSMWFVPPCSRVIGRCPRNVWPRWQGLAAQTRRVMQAAARRRVQIAVDIFCMATQYTDLASLGPLAHYTCGQVCSITHFPTYIIDAAVLESGLGLPMQSGPGIGDARTASTWGQSCNRASSLCVGVRGLCETVHPLAGHETSTKDRRQAKRTGREAAGMSQERLPRGASGVVVPSPRPPPLWAQVNYYPNFVAERDGAKLRAELTRNLTRETGAPPRIIPQCHLVHQTREGSAKCFSCILRHCLQYRQFHAAIIVRKYQRALYVLDLSRVM